MRIIALLIYKVQQLISTLNNQANDNKSIILRNDEGTIIIYFYRDCQEKIFLANKMLILSARESQGNIFLGGRGAIKVKIDATSNLS